jgi:hypothetical protein
MDIKPKRRWFRFSLRTLLVVVTILSVWLGYQLNTARQQAASNRSIKQIGGWSYYDFQQGQPKTGPNASAVSPLPDWLIDWFGNDFFHPIVEVNLVYHYDARQARHENAAGSGDDLKFLEGLPQLRSLCLHKYQVSDDGFQYVGRASNLERLFVWDAFPITDRGVKHLHNLRNLEMIHLSNSKITDQSLKVLAKLPRLKNLSLQGNAFTNRGLEYLQEMTQLTDLWVGLGETTIDDDGIPYLTKLVNLKELDLQQSNVTASGLAVLHKALPNCNVHHSPSANR